MNAKMILPVVLAATGIGVAPTTAAQAAPRCTAGQLSAHLGSAGGAAGSIYVPIVWTNKSETACTLFGYPGVAYVAPRSGDQVGAAATRNPQHPAQTVLLRPGQHASAMLQMANYQNYPKARCRPATVSGLRVYPPGSQSAEYVPFTENRKACSTDVHQLHVEATVKGKSGM